MPPAGKYEKFKVLGYIRPQSAFHTLDEWEDAVNELIRLQNAGFDTRGGKINCKHATFCSQENLDQFIGLIKEYWSYQLDVEVERYDLLTTKNILDFIEDFVNHRFWGLEQEFGSYFPDIRKLKFAYFYSRGDMEPYVMLDDEYTMQIYGTSDAQAQVKHFTSPDGLKRLEQAIYNGETLDISTFSVARRPFFRESSTITLTLTGNLRAAFRSDIKSLALDNGRRACNMYRLEYPGRDVNNICYDLSQCEDVRTGLWNEYIVTPINILNVEETN